MGGLRGELGAVTVKEEEGMRSFSHQDGANLTLYNTRTLKSVFKVLPSLVIAWVVWPNKPQHFLIASTGTAPGRTCHPFSTDGQSMAYVGFPKQGRDFAPPFHGVGVQSPALPKEPCSTQGIPASRQPWWAAVAQRNSSVCQGRGRLPKTQTPARERLHGHPPSSRASAVQNVAVGVV